ncbi:MAG: L,D-transpeptidase [Chloroflexota bacterium]|nr:L,D-transpeptidase [Chloroflexota bacterium]
MKKILLVIFLTLLIFTPTDTAAAQSGDDDANLPLCLPGMTADSACMLYGPAQTVADMKAAGFPYPARDLPAAVPSSELGVLPVYVARINAPEDQPAPIYASFDDAVARTNAIDQVDPGTLRYVSYVSLAQHNDKTYLQLASGRWIKAAPAAYTDFQGLLFYETPRNDFGWVVDETPGYREPTLSAATTGRTYYREDVVQVYQTVEAEGLFWYEIARDEWVNSAKTRVVHLRPEPPEGVTTNRWIEIDLFEQVMAVYEEGQLQFATIVATGVEPFYTRPGVFQIDEKKPLETMRGAFEADRSDFYYLQDVPWTMYFDEARALHAAYWRTFFGYPQSHGCVNLSPGDANWLFQWADEGDYVWVHDPSGRTPTDPALYGPGAP